MYVGWNMKTHLVTVTPETTVFKARELMDGHRISHLPVTDGAGHLVGIVTDRDLKEAWASPATTLSVHELAYILQKMTVANVMTQEVLTATPDMTIERAANLMIENKIGALPVVRAGRLLGIMTVIDLMELLLIALGLGDDSKRFSLLIADRDAVSARVASLLNEAGIGIHSVIVAPLRGHDGVWQLILRVGIDDYSRAVELLSGESYSLVTEYVEDLTPYLP